MGQGVGTRQPQGGRKRRKQGDRGGGIHWNVDRGRDTGEGDIGEGV